jgi:SAM-dependent methyltransferase
MAFDIEEEAFRYARGFPFPQTEAQLRQFADDWLHKEEQVEVGMRFFDRDVRIDVRDRNVLELGCGAGAMSFAFEKRGGKVTGVDIDQRVLDVASRWAAARGSRCRFLRCESKLPFPDGEFDLVYSSSTFEHVAEPELVLRELARVIRPDGLVNLNFPNRLWPAETHTNLRFLPWMPRSIAQRYLGWRLPGWNLDTLWFYSYPDFLRVLRRSQAPLRVVCPAPEPGAGLKYQIKQGLYRVGIPYSALTPGLTLLLVRTGGSV